MNLSLEECDYLLKLIHADISKSKQEDPLFYQKKESKLAAEIYDKFIIHKTVGYITLLDNLPNKPLTNARNRHMINE